MRVLNQRHFRAGGRTNPQGHVEYHVGLKYPDDFRLKTLPQRLASECRYTRCWALGQFGAPISQPAESSQYCDAGRRDRMPQSNSARPTAPTRLLWLA